MPRVGRSERTMQLTLTIIQYFTINSDNGEWSGVPHGGQKQSLDKYDNFLEKHIHLPLPIALSFFLKVRKEEGNSHYPTLSNLNCCSSVWDIPWVRRGLVTRIYRNTSHGSLNGNHLGIRRMKEVSDNLMARPVFILLYDPIIIILLCPGLWFCSIIATATTITI